MVLYGSPFTCPGKLPTVHWGGGFYGKFPTGQAQGKRKANTAQEETDHPAGNVA